MRLLSAISLVTVVVVLYGVLHGQGPEADRALGLNATPCKTLERSVIVDLDNTRHRHILDHAWDAQAGDERQSAPASRDGQREPRLLHWDPGHARQHRAQSLRGIPTQPGMDRDEYPPASSREGGAGADVRYVDASENRSAGSRMGTQLRPYCAGQPFRFERRSR